MKAAAHHVESLDVFRGLTIAAMILVNNPGDWSAVFTPLVHANWTGWTFADLVFPSFLFIMGFTMPFALERRRTQGARTPHLHRRIARRALTLVALGLVLNAVASWPSDLPLRFPGVLQRIALVYLIAMLAVLHLDVRGWIAVASLLLLGHWALLSVVPVEGYAAGTLEPMHNLARHIDTIVFGRHVLASAPTDPENLLGTLSAAATALGGAVAGHAWRSATSNRSRVASLTIVGVSMLGAGLVWSRVLPISKPLWTSSYALFAGGIATLAFLITFILVDVVGIRGWARPFQWLGVNPLAIYVLSEILGHLLDAAWIHRHGSAISPKLWLFWGVLEPAFRPWRAEWASISFSVLFVALWLAAAGLLYRKHLRIAV